MIMKGTRAKHAGDKSVGEERRKKEGQRGRKRKGERVMM